MHSLCAAAICFWCFKQDNFCPLYGKFQNVNHFRILSFKMVTLNRPSFNEIGEMTCITHAWLSPGETLKSITDQPLLLGAGKGMQETCKKKEVSITIHFPRRS